MANDSPIDVGVFVVVVACICGTPGITYGCAVCAGQMIFIKSNCLTF